MTVLNDWQPKDGLHFNKKSLGIIKSNQNIAIMAGPGAGKTEILAQKACFLLETDCCPWPHNILSISRKRESASNIKSRVALRCGDELSERFHSFTIEAFTKSILDRFMSILPKNKQPSKDYELVYNANQASFPSKLTFDQVTQIALLIVKSSSELMKSIRVTYKYVFIDEFQDLNNNQYEFVKLIFCQSECIVTVVGDSKQAIMKFAHALPDGFIRFKKDYQAKVEIINSNFRSSPELKQFLENIGHQWWSSTEKNKDDTLHLDKNNYGLYCFKNESNEVRQLSLKIKQWIDEEKMDPKEIAVLFRSNVDGNYSDGLAKSLLQLGVLSVNESNLQDYLSEPLGKIMVSFLSLLTRPRSSESWETLRDLYLYSCVIDNDNSNFKLDQMIEYIHKYRVYGNSEKKTFEEIVDITVNFMDDFFYENLLKTWGQYNQGTLMNDTFNGVLNELELAKDKSKNWKGAVDLISGVDAVRMMTIHKSKGLEFEAVILLGFEDYSYFRYNMTVKKLDEERSTIFVALSRAKSKLIISLSLNRKHTGGSKFLHIKQVINDLSRHGLNKQRIEDSNTLTI